MENQEPQSIQPQAPVQPVPQPVSGQKIEAKKPLPKLPLIITAILIILVLALPMGGYLVLNRLGIHPKPSTVTIKTTATPIPTPTSDPTANWKTYRTGTYSFDVPPDWTVYNPGAKSGGIDEADFQSSGQISKGYFILQAWFNKRTPEAISNTNTTPNGYKYSFVRTQNLEGVLGIISQTVYIYDPSGGYEYLVVNTPADEKDLLSKILSTFKFADQTTQTNESANWNTYNSSCGFSVKYPNTFNVRGYFLTPSENSCAYLTSQDYKEGVDSSEGFYLEIRRQKLGTKGVNTTINTLEDYITDNESIAQPPIQVTNKENATIGNFSGIKFEPIGIGGRKDFIFINQGYLYILEWPLNLDTQYASTINDILFSWK